ncbi:MAG: MFS transporter [Solirubrobacteraceae bacterium]
MRARPVRPREASAGTFAALRIRNYRLYFAGQAVSLAGTWMQSVALSWLVFELTHSGTAIGLVLAAEFLPVLVLGAYGGLVADRVPKRPLLIGTQTALASLATILGVLVITDVITLWMVFVLAALLGVVLAVDNPTRQTFVMEMVGNERIQNAVSLNSVLTNASRAVGPAVAGGLIALVGVGICFLANAASFLAVLAALALMRVQELHPTEPAGHEPGQLRAGFHYVRTTRGLLIPLLMMALIGTLAYEFPVVLPLLAHQSLHGGAGTFGFLTSAMGAGAVAGGLLVATLEITGVEPLTAAAATFGIAIVGAAAAPTFATELVALVLVGAASTVFMATGNSTLQLTSDPSFRGRVMALWSVTFSGSTPIGGPIVGVVCEFASPRAGLVLGAAACLLAAALGATAVTRTPPGERRHPHPVQMDWTAYQQAQGA